MGHLDELYNELAGPSHGKGHSVSQDIAEADYRSMASIQNLFGEL